MKPRIKISVDLQDGNTIPIMFDQDASITEAIKWLEELRSYLMAANLVMRIYGDGFIDHGEDDGN